MVNFKEMVLLVGNIGTGKSHYIKSVITDDSITINNDSIIMSIGAGHYNYVSKKSQIYDAATDSIITKAMQLGFKIYVDRTNMDIKSRLKYINLA